MKHFYFSIAILFFIQVFSGCSLRNKNDNETKRLSSSIEKPLEGVNKKVKLVFGDTEVEVVVNFKKMEFGSDQLLDDGPAVFDQKVIIRNGKLVNNCELPIPLIDQKTIDGNTVKVYENIISQIKILRGENQDFIWIFNERTCGTCPSYSGIYDLNGKLLFFRYSRIINGRHLVLDSLGDLNSIYETHKLNFQKEANDNFNPILNVDYDSIDQKDVVYEPSLGKNYLDLMGKSIISLPFDFESYYNYCFVDHNEDCKDVYPSYVVPEDLSVDLFKSEVIPSTYFVLPCINGFDVVLFWYDSDVEAYTLVTMKDNKIIQEKVVGEMGDEGIVSFKISKDYLIEQYFQRNSRDSAVPYKKFYLAPDGKFLEK